jgi:hypothetical protein
MHTWSSSNKGTVLVRPLLFAKNDSFKVPILLFMPGTVSTSSKRTWCWSNVHATDRKGWERGNLGVVFKKLIRQNGGTVLWNLECGFVEKSQSELTKATSARRWHIAYSWRLAPGTWYSSIRVPRTRTQVQLTWMMENCYSIRVFGTRVLPDSRIKGTSSRTKRLTVGRGWRGRELDDGSTNLGRSSLKR